ncbi:glycosyltransferase [Rugamonas sp. CCM 8940]|uniref:glycosyltransferase n=1 Tax=Rugamonas sp. CCM 8940 TaxID=2765359 RepID=UPI0018F71716|nr:glycosyltransferase [Rugamonas sp. CCM 8940]MBJ7313310.1 glycosyltransferase [Rugamonas sp. CCM 8940]
MRIILDLQACQAASMHRGIGRYSMALAQAMARQCGGHELHLALNGQFDAGATAVRAAFDTLLPAERIHVFDMLAPVAEYDPRNAWRARAAERLRQHYLAGLKPDVVHLASLFEGLSDDAVAACPPSSGRFASAVTLYDLIPLLRKDVYLTEPRAAAWYYRKLQGLKNAELLLAISGHSRREGLAALQLPAERIVNISSAVDPIFRPRQLSEDAATALRARYGLSRRFIMYTGGVDYRKNIEGLIEAYAMLPEALRRGHQLAVVCSIQPTDRHRLQQLATKLGLPDGDLVLTGFVSDDDLVSLYNSTALFVFPSLQEGFGLPALEAMQCGVPVIGSDSSSIPEVIGRADALFDPTSVAAISAKMAQVLDDAGFAATLAAHGLEQAKLFSWDASAKTALAAFEDCHAARQGASGAVAATGRRPRLAYVSPLPPERSGIADYSADLLPELARYYEIDVVLAQDKVGEPWLDANFAQRSVEWFDGHAGEYDRIVYHFGNSAFHQHMFGLLERHPGVVVLHDFFMSGITNYAAGASPYPNAYSRALYLSHGYRALIDERADGLEASIYQYPCNRSVLDHAAGIIVHSQHSRQLAEHWYGAGSAADWRMIPLLRMLPERIDKAAARRLLGIPDGQFVVCSFGMLAVTKCNDQIVEAWLGSALASDTDARLVFVGENDALQFGRALEQRIAGSNVSITGFASQDSYRLYLAAADAAVQLRSRSRGETSATVLDCLSFRLPTVINAHGSAAEVPAHVAIRLADRFSRDDLAAALLRLRREPALRALLSDEAGAYMAALHHPARIGVAYRDAIEEFARDGAHTAERELLAALAAIDGAVGPDEADLLATASCIAANRPRAGQPQVLVDVSALADSTRRPADAAAQEALLLRLLAAPPDGHRVEPVLWRHDHYRYARRYALALIERPELVLDEGAAELRAGDYLLSPYAAAPAIAAATLANRGVRQLALPAGDDTEAALAQLTAALAPGGATAAAPLTAEAS